MDIAINHCPLVWKVNMCVSESQVMSSCQFRYAFVTVFTLNNTASKAVRGSNDQRLGKKTCNLVMRNNGTIIQIKTATRLYLITPETLVVFQCFIQDVMLPHNGRHPSQALNIRLHCTLANLQCHFQTSQFDMQMFKQTHFSVHFFQKDRSTAIQTNYTVVLTLCNITLYRHQNKRESYTIHMKLLIGSSNRQSCMCVMQLPKCLLNKHG